MNLPKSLLTLRNEKGLNKSQISDLLNINRTTYGDYENGRTEPNISTLIKIADFFNTTIDTLVGRTLEKGNLNKNNGEPIKEENSNLKGNAMGNLKQYKEANYQVQTQESQSQYQVNRMESEREALREVIATKNQLIEALEAQIKLYDRLMK